MSEPAGPAPAISVVMPVYNAGGYLRSAVTSVLQQDFGDFELIAVDDGSKDDSLAILRDLAAQDARVRILSRANTGIVGALNDGIALARGEFLARMDADDLCHARRFTLQVEALRKNESLVAVGSAFYYIDSRGAFICRTPRPQGHEEIEAGLLQGDGGSLIHPAVVFRTEAVRRVGAYRQEAIWIEDLDLYLRLARVGRLANLPEALFWYRLHEQSVNFTRNEGRQQRKLAVLKEAWAARGLDFREDKLPATAFSNSIPLERCLDFAVSSLAFGRRGRPWFWLRRALAGAPLNRRCLSTLSYLLRAGLGLIKVRACAPETDL